MAITEFSDNSNPVHAFADDALETTAGVFIHDDSHPRGALVHVFGEATFADTAALESIIVGAIRIGRLVVVDMRECTYMDCAAIGIIVRAARDIGDLLRLVVPRRSQGYRMLDVTGLTRVLHVFDTIDAAMAPLVEPAPRLRSV
jgi:anti-anti-sigma factor